MLSVAFRVVSPMHVEAGSNFSADPVSTQTTQVTKIRHASVDLGAHTITRNSRLGRFGNDSTTRASRLHRRLDSAQHILHRHCLVASASNATWTVCWDVVAAVVSDEVAGLEEGIVGVSASRRYTASPRRSWRDRRSGARPEAWSTSTRSASTRLSVHHSSSCMGADMHRRADETHNAGCCVA